VFAEASAFGVPCLGTAVGGLPTVIKDDVNGHLFPLDAVGEDYADWILDVLSNQTRYEGMALSAAEHAATHLSWSVAGRRIAAILNDVVRERPIVADRLGAEETAKA
jgi:glycosyltransferase involved in cell wall biosynthesis